MKNSEKVAKIISYNVHRITDSVIEYEQAIDRIRLGPKYGGPNQDDYQIIKKCEYDIKHLTDVNKNLRAFHKLLVKDGK